MTFDFWKMCSRPPASSASPDELRAISVSWQPAIVPGTVGAALQQQGHSVIDSGQDLDLGDWWFQTSFRIEPSEKEGLCFLCFDGLATHAEVWLNGKQILLANNMFRSYRVDVSEQLELQNEISMVFRSLTHDLKTKLPRPRWKTNVVANQQLRWHRTSLLGRIPGWSPVVAPIGPWRSIHLETSSVQISSQRLTTSVVGPVGTVRIEAIVDFRWPIEQAIFEVEGQSSEATVLVNGCNATVTAELNISNPKLWWPHTHGEPALYSTRLIVHAHGQEHIVDTGKIGFRTVSLVPGNDFGIEVNGVEIYCRGACWTISDIVNFGGTKESIRRDLQLARDAHINMLRVGGTMIYESEEFYKICDEIGILIWQDFMFANMDYPFDDPAFNANVTEEIRQQLTRLAQHPCMAIYCGGSEIEQQVAMLGMPRETWSSPWFSERLPNLCEELHTGTLYVSSSPTGGVLPFHNRTGVSHYYGIGAYKRSIHELRKSNVKFTSETLGFANVPDANALNELMGGALPVVHHPKWKRGVPRDTGAGWDFDDIRDYYLRELFRVDPVELRYENTPRYLQLSRIVVGELMAQTFSEWRSSLSQNRGGLVWFYKDLQLGAGWGIIDRNSQPKAVYYYLRRTWNPKQLVITDEILDGLHLHAINETHEPLIGSLELTLLKDQHIVVAHQETSITVSPRNHYSIGSDELLGRFYDVTHAYRFGPPNHELAIATLYDDHRQVLSEAFYFVKGRELLPTMASAMITSSAEAISENQYRVIIQSDRFLQSVTLQAKGYLPSDNYFHLAPGRKKMVVFYPTIDSPPTFKASMEALNLSQVETIRLGNRFEP